MIAKTTENSRFPLLPKRTGAQKPVPAQSYVPLWCKSNYSFLEGASHPEELVDACQQKGIPSLALTDRNGVYGIVKAHVRADRLGIHLIVGSQLSLQDGSEILLLLQNKVGYQNLCHLLTKGHRRSSKGKCKLSWQEVYHSNPGLIALWIGRSEPDAPPEGGPERVPEQLESAFEDRLYLLLTRHCRAEEVLREDRLRRLADRFDLPMVAAVEVLYHAPERRRLQDVLTCIREGVTLNTAGRLIQPNDQYALQNPDDLAKA